MRLPNISKVYLGTDRNSISSYRQKFLEDLVLELFQNDYFSYMESSIEYVQNLIENTEKKLHQLKYHSTPNALKSYGELYISYQSSKRTTWYIFFSKKGNRVLVKYIMNNHGSEAGLLEHL